MKKILLALALVLGLTSCEKEPIPTCYEITGFEYTPTESGRYKIYTITDEGVSIVRFVNYNYWLEVVGGQHFEWCGER